MKQSLLATSTTLLIIILLATTVLAGTAKTHPKPLLFFTVDANGLYVDTRSANGCIKSVDPFMLPLTTTDTVSYNFGKKYDKLGTITIKFDNNQANNKECYTSKYNLNNDGVKYDVLYHASSHKVRLTPKGEKHPRYDYPAYMKKEWNGGIQGTAYDANGDIVAKAPVWDYPPVTFTVTKQDSGYCVTDVNARKNVGPLTTVSTRPAPGGCIDDFTFHVYEPSNDYRTYTITKVNQDEVWVKSPLNYRYGYSAHDITVLGEETLFHTLEQELYFDGETLNVKESNGEVLLDPECEITGIESITVKKAPVDSTEPDAHTQELCGIATTGLLQVHASNDDVAFDDVTISSNNGIYETSKPYYVQVAWLATGKKKGRLFIHHGDYLAENSFTNDKPLMIPYTCNEETVAAAKKAKVSAEKSAEQIFNSWTGVINIGDGCSLDSCSITYKLTGGGDVNDLKGRVCKLGTYVHGGSGPLEFGKDSAKARWLIDCSKLVGSGVTKTLKDIKPTTSQPYAYYVPTTYTRDDIMGQRDSTGIIDKKKLEDFDSNGLRGMWLYSDDKELKDFAKRKDFPFKGTKKANSVINEKLLTFGEYFITALTEQLNSAKMYYYVVKELFTKQDGTIDMDKAKNAVNVKKGLVLEELNGVIEIIIDGYYVGNIQLPKNFKKNKDKITYKLLNDSVTIGTTKACIARPKNDETRGKNCPNLGTVTVNHKTVPRVAYYFQVPNARIEAYKVKDKDHNKAKSSGTSAVLSAGAEDAAALFMLPRPGDSEHPLTHVEYCLSGTQTINYWRAGKGTNAKLTLLPDANNRPTLFCSPRYLLDEFPREEGKEYLTAHSEPVLPAISYAPSVYTDARLKGSLVLDKVFAGIPTANTQLEIAFSPAEPMNTQGKTVTLPAFQQELTLQSFAPEIHLNNVLKEGKEQAFKKKYNVMRTEELVSTKAKSFSFVVSREKKSNNWKWNFAQQLVVGNSNQLAAEEGDGVTIVLPGLAKDSLIKSYSWHGTNSHEVFTTSQSLKLLKSHGSMATGKAFALDSTPGFSSVVSKYAEGTVQNDFLGWIVGVNANIGTLGECRDIAALYVIATNKKAPRLEFFSKAQNFKDFLALLQDHSVDEINSMTPDELNSILYFGSSDEAGAKGFMAKMRAVEPEVRALQNLCSELGLPDKPRAIFLQSIKPDDVKGIRVNRNVVTRAQLYLELLPKALAAERRAKQSGTAPSAPPTVVAEGACCPDDLSIGATKRACKDAYHARETAREADLAYAGVSDEKLCNDIPHCEYHADGVC